MYWYQDFFLPFPFLNFPVSEGFVEQLQFRPWAGLTVTRISCYRAKIYKIASEVFRFQVLLIYRGRFYSFSLFRLVDLFCSEYSTSDRTRTRTTRRRRT